MGGGGVFAGDGVVGSVSVVGGDSHAATSSSPKATTRRVTIVVCRSYTVERSRARGLMSRRRLGFPTRLFSPHLSDGHEACQLVKPVLHEDHLSGRQIGWPVFRQRSRLALHIEPFAAIGPHAGCSPPLFDIRWRSPWPG